MAVLKDLIYRPGSDRGLLDLTLPEGRGPFPVVVCLHGGGWTGGSKEKMAEYARLLSTAGFAAVASNYRLIGTHTHPAQEQDVFAVLDWIADHAADHALDPGRIGLTGASAGVVAAGCAGSCAGAGRTAFNLFSIFFVKTKPASAAATPLALTAISIISSIT